jgi:hypothetical protein
MPVSSFIIGPTNTVISTFSHWGLILNVNIPLEENCWIEFFLPRDLGYQNEEIEASGMFLAEDLSPIMTDDKLIITTKNGADIPKSSILFNGCFELSALGPGPFGRLDIKYISTQSSLKDSEPFEIKIYKD